MKKIKVKKIYYNLHHDNIKTISNPTGYGIKTSRKTKTFTVSDCITTEEGNKIKQYCQDADDIIIIIDGKKYGKDILNRM